MKKETTKNKLASYLLIVGVGLLACGLIILLTISLRKKPSFQTILPIVKSENNQILADGQVRSENETTLHFAVSGKLTYLPFKEGDYVKKGQTIASLDTYVLQRQLNAALNTYRSTRDSFDQQNDNNETNYLDAQLNNPYPYNYWNLGGINSSTKTNAVNDMIKRMVDQAQAGLDNSVIQVEIANYALSLASIQAPFDGVITHMDVSSTNVMIGPTTGFTIIDPNAYVFRGNVAEEDLDFVSENLPATIQLTSKGNRKLSGVVTKIYPDKITLPTGESVYQVDIISSELDSKIKYRQTGNALIKNHFSKDVVLVPRWLVLNKQYVWIEKNGQAQLKKISIGKTIGDNLEVYGLGKEKIIVSPVTIAQRKYWIL